MAFQNEAGWHELYKVSDCKIDNLNKVLYQYEFLFSNRLGKMKNFQAKIHVKENAKSCFFKARNVPFAIQDAVNQELDRLEWERILNSVSYSEWASHIVIVPKPNGHIRLCADYKQTVIEVGQYPLPTAEELFKKIQGGIY